MTDAQREQFEKWRRTRNHHVPDAMFNRNSDGDYENHSVQLEWEAYDAGAAAENEACAKIVEAMKFKAAWKTGLTLAQSIAEAIRARRKEVEP